MANKKVSEFTPATAVASADELPMVQGGVTKKIAASAVLRRGLRGFCSGKPANDEVVAGVIAASAITLVEANCSALALVAATGSTTFTVKNDGVSIGTIVFAAAGTSGTVDITTAAVAAGDHITVHAPATADSTLADITFLITE